LIRVPESFGQKERGGESKKKLNKKNQPILFLVFWDRFEPYAITVNFFSSARFLEQFRAVFGNFKKNLDPILIFHLADRFETISIIVIFASFARYSEHCYLLLFGVAA
jgi:hypothetical protein